MKINGHLYQLSNKNILRIDSSCDNPECEYIYDYFDGKTLRLIDGGVFNMEDGNNSVDAVIKEAIAWCSLDPDDVTYDIIMEDVEYDDLESLGYSGF